MVLQTFEGFRITKAGLESNLATPLSHREKKRKRDKLRKDGVGLLEVPLVFF